VSVALASADPGMRAAIHAAHLQALEFDLEALIR